MSTRRQEAALNRQRQAQEQADRIIDDAIAKVRGRPIHEPIVTRYEPAPRGWREAWVWTCACGVESISILRSPEEARANHRQEHLAGSCTSGGDG